MSKNEIWGFRIQHILQAIDEIEQFVEHIDFEAFMSDPKTLRAVERNIEIIGEAASKVPDEVRNLYPDIPWGGMKGMRNAVAHGYDQIEYESVWDVIKLRLPELKVKLQNIQVGNAK